MTDYPDAPTVALEPGTTCARCQRPCTDYKTPGPVCILCVTDEHDATIAALTRERDEARAKASRLRAAVEEALATVQGIAALAPPVREGDFRALLLCTPPSPRCVDCDQEPEFDGRCRAHAEQHEEEQRRRILEARPGPVPVPVEPTPEKVRQP